MAQVTIKITRDENEQVTFTPSDPSVTTQDNVCWVNYDEEPHLPTPLDKNGKMVPDTWLSCQIPGKEPDLPATSSGSVAFFNPSDITGENTQYTVTYICANHPDRKNEIGYITVTQ